MAERVVCIIQARLGSTRFPRKVLEDIGGKPMIAHVIERVKAIPEVDDCVVAVADSSEQYELRGMGCDVMATGAKENDVLSRLRLVAFRRGADYVVRITSDCPLLAPDVCQRVLRWRETFGAAYAWNVCDGYVDGTDCEVVTMGALATACRSATSEHDREHVTPWVRRHFPIVTAPVGGDYSSHKWSVDTLDDLARVRQIMAHVKGLNFADTLAACAEAGV